MLRPPPRQPAALAPFIHPACRRVVPTGHVDGATERVSGPLCRKHLFWEHPEARHGGQ